MPELIFPLDHRQRHYITITFEAHSTRVVLCRTIADRYSRLHAILKEQLKFNFDDILYSFAANSEEFTLPTAISQYRILLDNQLLAYGQINLSKIIEQYRYILSPFETRSLVQNGHPHIINNNINNTVNNSINNIALTINSKPHTDLHTHFAGCIYAEDLIKIGVDVDAQYSAQLLQEAGLKTASKEISLKQLSPELLEMLADRLAVPVDNRIPFAEMERIYRLRSPITKHSDAFIPLCRKIAEDYRSMGVNYVELSLSNIIEKDRLEMIYKELPNIEAQTGVKLRFLAALGRHDDPEWDLDYIEQLKALAHCRYIVGIDFLGHETNSTRAFEKQLNAIGQWATQSRPGFTVRVHAGENPAHPENIRVAINALKDYQVQIRIGHGLFGVDDATMELIKSTNTIVEFNLNSNLALNNIQSSREVPIKRYLDAGVSVVLGTDGYGIYQTSLAMEMQAATLAGLNIADLESIFNSEEKYIASRFNYDEQYTTPIDQFIIPEPKPFIHYTPEVNIRKAALKRERDEKLLARLSALSIPLLNKADVEELLHQYEPISFAGAWAYSWQKLSQAEQQYIEKELKELIELLDPQKYIIVSGGTNYGVENIVQHYARLRGFKRLGIFVWETPPTSIVDEAITHAYIVGENLFNKAAGLYLLMKQFNGFCLFIGGGNIVNDEIQTAYNLRLRYLLMTGIAGASSLHAEQQPQRAFNSAQQIIEHLKIVGPWISTNEPYWHLGVNPTVDIVLTRTNPTNQRLEVLFIRRDDDAPTEPGKWALPGGFQHTNAPRGSVWQADLETAAEACVRELWEETRLDIRDYLDQLLYVGDYQGNGRDPRDTATAWSRSSVFAFHLPDHLASAIIAGADDACDAAWMQVDPVPRNLAFDHTIILADGLAVLRGGKRSLP